MAEKPRARLPYHLEAGLRVIFAKIFRIDEDYRTEKQELVLKKAPRENPDGVMGEIQGSPTKMPPLPIDTTNDAQAVLHRTTI